MPKLTHFIILLTVLTPTCSLTFADPSVISSPPMEKAPIVLAQGEQRFLSLPGLIKYSIGGSSIRVLRFNRSLMASHDFGKDALLLKGIAPGQGDLWVWKSNGTIEFRTIHVEKKMKPDLPITLEKHLSKLTESEVIFSGKGVILRGPLTSLREAAQIHALVQAYPHEIHNETLPTEDLLNPAYTQLLNWVAQSGYHQTIRIERRGHQIWLRGHTPQTSESLLLENQAKGIYPLIQTELTALPDDAPLIHFQVFLIELRKSHFKTFGLNWSHPVQNAFQATLGGITDSLKIDLTLQQLESHGHAHILSHPQLVVRAPGEAELFAGGELPIQMSSRNYSNVSWKPYGLTLQLKVTHSTGDRVRLDILAEVSHLSVLNSQEGLPRIQSNRMKTQVDARYDHPLFLSGLLQQGMREEAKGLPFLKNIPVFGALFGSKDYLNEESELIAILCPSTTPPQISQKEISNYFPKGPIPPPRNWVSPQYERLLRQESNYPWNALE